MWAMDVEAFTCTPSPLIFLTFGQRGSTRSGPQDRRHWTGDKIRSRRWQGRHMWIEDWTPSAACRQAQPDELFVRGAEQNKAKQLCTGCPVRTECLAEALDNQIEWGVWGGMTERERRALLRRRPSSSWRNVLETARTKAETETQQPQVSA